MGTIQVFVEHSLVLFNSNGFNSIRVYFLPIRVFFIGGWVFKFSMKYSKNRYIYIYIHSNNSNFSFNFIKLILLFVYYILILRNLLTSSSKPIFHYNLKL